MRWEGKTGVAPRQQCSWRNLTKGPEITRSVTDKEGGFCFYVGDKIATRLEVKYGAKVFHVEDPAFRETIWVE